MYSYACSMVFVARKRDTIIYKDPDWTEIIEKGINSF